MKTEIQTSPELQHVADLVKDISVAMLTTQDSTGALVSRPMAALEMDTTGTLWFFTDTRSSKVAHLHKINLSFSDAASGTYVSLSGRGEVDTDRSHIKRLWTVFARPWFQDGPESQFLALLKFRPDAADYWDAPDSKMVRAWGMLASVVAGKPIAMGESGSHRGLMADTSAL